MLWYHAKESCLHCLVWDARLYPACAIMLQVYFDPKETNYSALLDCFFDHVDPTTLNQQGNDRGTQYRSGIYYHNEEQKAAAEKVGCMCCLRGMLCIVLPSPFCTSQHAVCTKLYAVWCCTCMHDLVVMSLA